MKKIRLVDALFYSGCLLIAVGVGFLLGAAAGMIVGGAGLIVASALNDRDPAENERGGER